MNKIICIPQRLIVYLLIFLAGFQWVFLPNISVASSSYPSQPDDLPIDQRPNQTLAQLERSPFVAGEILVGLHKERTTLAIQSARMAIHPLEALDLRGLDGREGDAGVAGYRLRVPAGEEWATIQKLTQDPAIAFATPNWIVRAALFCVPLYWAAVESAFQVTDPFYQDYQWYLQRIQASRAWSLTHEKSLPLRPIRIAILDSGVDFDHPDLLALREEGRLLDGFNYLEPYEAADDDYGHGSHITGLIGASLNNEEGIAGLADHVILDPRKVLNQYGGGTIVNVAQAIRDAVDDGAHIINLSLEAPEPSPDLEAAVAYAYSRGVLLIGAAGNAGSGKVRWPSAYPEVVAVAATDYRDHWVPYSNYGAEIEISAPGGIRHNNPIYSIWAEGAVCRDTNAPAEQYCSSVGTSMSAALVTGVAALIWGLRPELTAAEVRKILQETATPLEQSASYIGHGRLNAYGAVRWALRSQLQISPGTLRVESTVDTALLPLLFKLENPGLEPMIWSVEMEDGFTIDGLGGGTIRYGQPARLAINASPDVIGGALYQGNILFKAVRPDSTQIVQSVPIRLFGPDAHHLYLPAVSSPRMVNTSSIEAIPYQWELSGEQPSNLHILTDNSSASIQLPFSFPLKGESYETARISSDGFLAFPDGYTEGNNPNRCLADSQWPYQAIYGWWADLDPSRNSDSQVRSFQPDSERFVVEFSNVASAVGIIPAYTVSFQIVLHRDGQISLNYQETPMNGSTSGNRLVPVTIGVEAQDGRFYNQITCVNESTELGIIPISNQSIHIEPTDIY